MLARGNFRCLLISLPLMGYGLINFAYAADKSPNTRIPDVALTEGGRLEGQVVDYQGKVMPNVSVVLKADGVEPIPTTTTEEGRFAYEGVTGGVYQVVAKNGNGTTIRAWTSEAAPPNAQAEAVVFLQEVAEPEELPPNAPPTRGGPASRGNMRTQVGPLKRILSNPIVLPTAIATAIALPIALNSHGTPASP
jgi:hypothetical protein